MRHVQFDRNIYSKGDILYMGIQICLSISKSVTKEEWMEVYEETLKLVEAFPFAEMRKVNCSGIETSCLVRTVEREESYEWHNDKTRIGWETDGDYLTMKTAESYYLPKD